MILSPLRNPSPVQVLEALNKSARAADRAQAAIALGLLGDPRDKDALFAPATSTSLRRRGPRVSC